MNEDDLKWVENGKTLLILLTISIKEIVLKPLILENLGHFSEMRNDASMHREGLKGWVETLNMNDKV